MNKFDVIDFKEKKYDSDIFYPIGTVLWRMQGIRQNSEIKWYPFPVSVENHIEEPKTYIVTGGVQIPSKLLGKRYFLTREESLDDFLSSHRSLTTPIPIESSVEDFLCKEDAEEVVELPRTDFGELEICEFDTIVSSTVYRGGLSDLIKINDELEWKYDEEAAEKLEINELKYLSLNNIYEQVKSLYGEIYKGKIHTPLITVIIDEPLRGTIYQCNNHSEGVWEKIGDTRGYA